MSTITNFSVHFNLCLSSLSPSSVKNISYVFVINSSTMGISNNYFNTDSTVGLFNCLQCIVDTLPRIHSGFDPNYCPDYGDGVWGESGKALGVGALPYFTKQVNKNDNAQPVFWLLDAVV